MEARPSLSSIEGPEAGVCTVDDVGLVLDDNSPAQEAFGLVFC